MEHSHVHGIDGLDITLIDDMDEVFAQSDIISLHLPLLDGTAGIITSRQLDRMRPGSMIVNTARAEIIEPGALTRRLQRGDVRAAIDVFDHEPLPMDDPLRSLDNVVLTPHVAWRDDEACVNLTRQVIDAVASYFTGGDYNAVP